MHKLQKILFIDDDLHTNEYHTFVAKRSNIVLEILACTSAEEALNYLSALPSCNDFPELIFIDINMPAMSGHEFVTKVRTLKHFNEKQTQLAYLSTSFSDADLAEYAINDMKHFFFKTITDFDLKNIVKDIFPEREFL